MRKETIKKLPNRITMIRVILVILFIPALLFNDIASGSLGRFTEIAGGSSLRGMLLSYAALFLFVLAAVSDFFDGYIARKYDVVSNFGKVMDPLADKILVVSAMLGFIQLGIVPAWMVIIIIGREFLVSGIRIIAAQKGKIISASGLGKVKTVTQITAIIITLVFLCVNKTIIHYSLPREGIMPEGALQEISLLGILPYWLMFIAAAVSLVSGLEYYFKNKKIFEKEL